MSNIIKIIEEVINRININNKEIESMVIIVIGIVSIIVMIISEGRVGEGWWKEGERLAEGEERNGQG